MWNCVICTNSNAFANGFDLQERLIRNSQPDFCGRTGIYMHDNKITKHLKLVHTKKFARHLFGSVQICAKLGLARTRCFGLFELIIWSLRPIFGGRTSIILSKLWTCHCGELCINKIDGALIFAVLENNPKIWDCVRRVKIGLRSIFGMFISP